jgi:nucleotide-binding universal stress UspA family protein
MEISSKGIFVPWDFSEKTDAAIKYAKLMSSTTGKGITLVHIVKKSKFIQEAEEKLKSCVVDIKEKYGLDVSYVVRAGNLFKMISKTAQEFNASLIIMGMHSGKRAIKVIVGSRIPFLLIQNPPKRDKIIEIVVPVNEDEKNRVQLNWVIFLSKYFNSNINIIKPFISNNAKNAKMKANMQFTRKILDSKGVVYGIRTSKREDKFEHAVNKFAKEIDADMIFVMSYKFKKLVKWMEKEEITIPILCINPATDLKILPDKR